MFITVNRKIFINLNIIIMKKFVFTVLAVVAFSGVSMASTVEIKEGIVLSKTIKEALVVKLVEERNDCYDKAMDAVDCAGSNDSAYNHDLYQWVLANC
jgi:hypothetical protein